MFLGGSLENSYFFHLPIIISLKTVVNVTTFWRIIYSVSINNSRVNNHILFYYPEKIYNYNFIKKACLYFVTTDVLSKICLVIKIYNYNFINKA